MMPVTFSRLRWIVEGDSCSCALRAGLARAEAASTKSSPCMACATCCRLDAVAMVSELVPPTQSTC